MAKSSRKSLQGSSGNVLTDLGLPDADELSAKTVLALRLNEILDRRDVTQAEAARLLGMTQPKVSALRNYKLRGISLERLMLGLVALDHSVEIVVRPRRRSKAPAAIRVAA
jgi:predicted XRE-type DNA-binding protein